MYPGSGPFPVIPGMGFHGGQKIDYPAAIFSSNYLTFAPPLGIATGGPGKWTKRAILQVAVYESLIYDISYFIPYRDLCLLADNSLQTNRITG